MAMIKFKVKTKNCQLIVRAKLSFDEKIDLNELDRFSRNTIKGFLNPKQIKPRIFEFTGPIGVSLYKRLQTPVTKFEFFFIIEQIVIVLRELQKGQFSFGNVVWDINNSFINGATKELQFIYLPSSMHISRGNVMQFLETLVYMSNPTPDADTGYMPRFIFFLRNLKSIDCNLIENYIASEEPNAISVIKKHHTGSSGFLTDKRRDYLEHYEDEATGIMRQYDDDEEATGLLGQNDYDDDEDTTRLLDQSDYEDDEDTTRLLDQSDDFDEATGLLTESDDGIFGDALLKQNGSGSNTPQLAFPSLLRISTNETIRVNKAVFRIGKAMGRVDYCVADNNAVSRSHADIVTRVSGYYIVDQESKNKTYIDGQILPPYQECEIYDGSTLRLGNEEFIFQARG